jgi:hypothetical protein
VPDFDIATAKSLDSLDTVPPDFQPFYKKTDEGKFVIDDDSPPVKSAVKLVVGLSTALRNSRAEAKKGSVDLTPLKTYGNTPDEIATKINETIATLNEQIKGVNPDKMKGELAKQFAGEIETHKKTAEALKTQLYTVLVKKEAVDAIGRQKGDVELLLPFVEKHVQTVQLANGSFGVRVVDSKGEPEYNTSGGEMTVDELVAAMKTQPKYAKLFASESPKGGGAAPAAGARAGGPTIRPALDKSKMSPIQKIKAGLAGGHGEKPNAK